MHPHMTNNIILVTTLLVRDWKKEIKIVSSKAEVSLSNSDVTEIVIDKYYVNPAH